LKIISTRLRFRSLFRLHMTTILYSSTFSDAKADCHKAI